VLKVPPVFLVKRRTTPGNRLKFRDRR
jgi:hypothetical protein